MTNRLRGEVACSLGGTAYTLCLPFKEMLMVEETLHQGILDVAKVFAEGRAGLREITTILWCGMRGGGAQLSFEEVGDLVTREGISLSLTLAMTVLSRALCGQSHEEK